MEEARAPLSKPVTSQIPKFNTQKKAAERARKKANPEPDYENPRTWAEFQLTPELKNLEDGQQFLQYDSGRYVQGVPSPFFTFQEHKTQKQCTFDSMFVKPKYV